MNTKTRILIGILFIIILTLLAIVIAGAREKATVPIQNGDSPITGIVNPETPPTGNTSGGGTDAQPIACTMDAHMCADGSYVGRSGPNCEFVCPPTTPDPVVKKKVVVSSPVIPTSGPGESLFVFTKDYEVEQDVYSGGDYPSGTTVTMFKKGQVVAGKYGIKGCQGAGCTPTPIVNFNVNGQNWGVDRATLVPFFNESF